MKTFLRTVSVSVCLVLITVLCISGTVMSREKRTEEAEGKYYRELGSIYAEEMREFLKGQGYADCGVTVTSVEDESGARRYIVTIHHGRIDRMTQTEKERCSQSAERFCSLTGHVVFTINFWRKDC